MYDSNLFQTNKSKTVYNSHLIMSNSPLHSPRRDQIGNKTPSTASRLWFIFIISFSIYLGWHYSANNIGIWFLCSLTMATLLLNIGWLIFSKISEQYDPVELFTYLNEEE